MIKRLIQKLPITYYPYKSFMHKNKCIFIHIPKNAGTSVLALFNDRGGRKHAKWYDFYESNSYFFKRYHKFAIIREPLKRLYSSYTYGLNGGNQSVGDIALMNQIKDHSDDFNSFIESVLDSHFVMLHLLFQPQYIFIYDQQYNCMVDSILKFESLEHDWANFAALQGFTTELPKKNSTINSNIPTISSKAHEKVSELYDFDYKLLGYSPDKLSQ